MLLAVVAVAALLWPLGTAVAAPTHDAFITTTFSDLNMQTFDHYDADPFKGAVYVDVTNTTSETWTDFHFEILDIGWDISSVFFDVSPGYEPTSSQSPLSWVLGVGTLGGDSIDLFFSSDPVLPGEAATFVVYTNNETTMNPFGLGIWPTVPEPTSGLLILLGLGGLMVLRARS
jgi:hypothetical protein